MEKGEKKRCPDEISTTILQQQLLREGLNALPEGKGSGEKGKAGRAEPRAPRSTDEAGHTDSASTSWSRSLAPHSQHERAAGYYALF